MWEHPTTNGVVRVLVSSRADGDFNLDVVAPPSIERRRRALVDLPWTMLDERHGTGVVHVERPGGGDREVGDVAVTTLAGVVLAAWAGDCAPIVLVADDGVIAVVHAGWRGLAAGILDAAVDAVGTLGSGALAAYVGPSIHGCCYEFGPEQLNAVALGTHCAPASVTASTSWGTMSLDVPAAVRTALGRRGVTVLREGPCTGCDDTFFSHRVRAEPQRHVVAVWREVA